MLNSHKIRLGLLFFLLILISTCFLPAAWGATLPKSVVNPVDYGADITGTKDSTSAFQRAVDSVEAGGKVLVPDGTFLINVAAGVRLKSDISFIMSPGTVLKALPSNLEGYGMIKAYETKNITISGGTLIGDRSTHLGTTGEWGFGIAVKGSKNISILNVTARDFWGDGFYIDQLTKYILSENIKVQGCKAVNNRRQGISICQGTNITITDSSFTDTNGMWPQAGIDIEPYKSRVIQNLTINKCSFNNNKGSGILVYGDGTGVIRGVVIRSSISKDNSQNGARLYNCFGTTLAANQFKNNGYHGILIDSAAYDNIANGNLLEGNLKNGIQLSSAQGNQVINNTFRKNRGSGVLLDNAILNLIRGNKVSSNSYVGVRVSNKSDTNFINGNVVESSGANGIMLDGSSENEVIANKVVFSSQAAKNKYSNIWIGNSSSRNTILGNTCRKGKQANQPIYGVQITDANCIENHVADNDLVDSGRSGNFFDRGTRTKTKP